MFKGPINAVHRGRCTSIRRQAKHEVSHCCLKLDSFFIYIISFISKQIYLTPTRVKMRGHRVEDLPEDFWIPIPLDTNNITSLSPYLVPQDHLGSKTLFYSLSVFMFFLFVTGFSINVLTIACTAQYKKLRSHLNYILVNMAVANLIVSVAGSFTCFYCFSSRYMALGPLGCKIEGFSATLGGKDCIDIDKLYCVTYWQGKGLHWISLTLTYIVNKLHVITFIPIVLFSGMVSLWSLAVIAFERWLVICKPLGNFAFKSEHALFFCVLTWFFALCAAVPPLVGWSRWAQEHQIKKFFFKLKQAVLL